MEARRVVGTDVGLAETLRGSTVFRFIAARFKRWNTVTRNGRCVGSEPTCVDSITTSSHTISESSGRGFLVESSKPA
jgi:hypothetical protein